MPRASRAKVAKAPQAELAVCTPSDPSDDDVPAVNLLKKPAKVAKSKNTGPKPTQPIMNSLHEVMRELEERRAKPKDINELKVEETISKLKDLRAKAEEIFGTCLSDLDELYWSIN